MAVGVGEEWRSSGRGRAGGAGRSRNDRGVRLRSPVPSRQSQEVLGAGGWAVGLGGASPGPFRRSRAPCEGPVVCLRSAAHVAEPLRALPDPARSGETSRRSRVRPWSTASAPPRIEGAPGGKSEVNVNSGWAARAGRGRCAGFDPDASRQLVLSPGLVGPGSTIPPRAPRTVAGAGAIAWLRSCNPNARRDDFLWWAARPQDRAAGELLDPVVPAAGTRAVNQGS